MGQLSEPQIRPAELGIGTLKAWAKADDPEGYDRQQAQVFEAILDLHTLF